MRSKKKKTDQHQYKTTQDAPKQNLKNIDLSDKDSGKEIPYAPGKSCR